MQHMAIRKQHMPLMPLELLIGITILLGVPVTTIILNKRKKRLGWIFLVSFIVLATVGKLLEVLLHS
jgi:hypothetical protein